MSYTKRIINSEREHVAVPVHLPATPVILDVPAPSTVEVFQDRGSYKIPPVKDSGIHSERHKGCIWVRTRRSTPLHLLQCSATTQKGMFDMQNVANYHLRRKYFRLFGSEMRIFDENDNLSVYAEGKRMKIKEELTVYSDEQKTQPLVSIKARKALDFRAVYDIKDPESSEVLATLRRKGWTSEFLQDSWEVLDPQEHVIGTIKEDTTAMSFLRRFSDLVSLVVPQNYAIAINGGHVGTLRRSINLFVVKYDMSFDGTYLQNNDWRIPLSCPIVMALVEDSKD